MSVLIGLGVGVWIVGWLTMAVVAARHNTQGYSRFRDRLPGYCLAAAVELFVWPVLAVSWSIHQVRKRREAAQFQRRLASRGAAICPSCGKRIAAFTTCHGTYQAALPEP